MSGNIKNRRNWTRSLTVVLFIAFIGVLISSLPSVSDKKAGRLYLQSNAGAVLFDHEKHKDAAESCLKCHHDLYSATQATSCSDCHEDEYSASDFEHSELKEFHILDCAKCHEQATDKRQAVSCRECHSTTQSSETLTNNCSECHDDSYSPEIMDHDEYTEVEDHTCQGCHTPRALSDAYHINCTNCHLESLPDRFSTGDGNVSCGACHLR